MKEYQSSLCSVYKFFTKNCPDYFNDIYVPFGISGIHYRFSYQKLNVPPRKTNSGQKALPYVALKSTSVNAFEHSIK